MMTSFSVSDEVGVLIVGTVVAGPLKGREVRVFGELGGWREGVSEGWREG